MAKPMPVLPEVASITVCPGLSSPDFSAASMTPSARRSLTEPSGLNASILTNRLMPFGPSLLILTTGVLPMVSRIFANLVMGKSSHIQNATIRIQHRFLHHLRQRRMREHGVHELFFRGLQVHGDDVALDQLGHFHADHVRAEQLSGLFVEDHFHQALILAERDRLAIADEGKAADADVDFLVLGGLLGKTDGCNL